MKLCELVSETEVRIAHESGLKPEVHVFQNVYNPQVMYCRLRELGMSKPVAKKYMKSYEHVFYNPVLNVAKNDDNNHFTTAAIPEAKEELQGLRG